jgi:hypothetical protein
MDGREEEIKQGFSGDLMERNHLEGLDVDGRMLLTDLKGIERVFVKGINLVEGSDECPAFVNTVLKIIWEISRPAEKMGHLVGVCGDEAMGVQGVSKWHKESENVGRRSVMMLASVGPAGKGRTGRQREWRKIFKKTGKAHSSECKHRWAQTVNGPSCRNSNGTATEFQNSRRGGGGVKGQRARQFGHKITIFQWHKLAAFKF